VTEAYARSIDQEDTMTSASEKTLPKKVTVSTLRQMKADGDRITMVTCYDATFARLCDAGGADVFLVGDSLGMVVQGETTTLPVTLEDIIYHSRAVRRGVSRAHVVADMPFMTYQGGVNEALLNAGRLLKEGGAESVKLEGGEEVCEAIEKMVRAGIPVMGHVGLTPQSVHAMGGFKIQGKVPRARGPSCATPRPSSRRRRLRHRARGHAPELARVITAQLSIPTIGIGAGKWSATARCWSSTTSWA
jgi:3-methyl-2-oxobutanoate hydroxymethyltransferase